MRRTYISPEFKNSSINGTFNMYEESNFFGSKMLEIEDKLFISDENILYNEKSNGEQLDLSIESSLQPIIYSSMNNISMNHNIKMDDTQLEYLKDKNTRWIIEVSISNILRNHLFAILKKYRTFEYVTNEMTKSYDINTSILSYIDNNILNRYKLSELNLYVSYNDLKTQNVLKFKNKFNSDIINESNLMVKKQIDYSYDNSSATIIFNQEKYSSEYNFDYYLTLNFEKI
jgi:hypothetical protein